MRFNNIRERYGNVFIILIAIITYLPLQEAVCQEVFLRVFNLFERPGLNPIYDEYYLVNNNPDLRTQSGRWADVYSPGTYSFRTEFPFYDKRSHIGYYYKFNRWNNIQPFFNFTKTEIIDQMSTFNSFLTPTYNAFLRVEWDCREVDRGILKFKDPWYITQDEMNQYVYHQPGYPSGTYWLNRNMAYNEGDLTYQKWGGIFKDVQRDPDIPDIPYYSIRAPLYMDYYGSMKTNLPLQPWDQVFHKWNTTSAVLTDDHSANQSPYYDTRAVKFTGDNANVTAWYKGHLISNAEQCATFYNSQRKIDVDENGYYHLVYESCGEIWYTWSLNNGQTWEPEQIVSDFEGVSHRPCIAEFKDTVYVVYVTDNGEVVLKSRRVGAGYSWEIVEEMTTNVPSDCRPVVEANSGCISYDDPWNLVFVVWEEDQFNLAYRVWEIQTNIFSLFDGYIRFQNSTQPTFPTLATRPEGHSFYLAWCESTEIYYSQITVFNCRGTGKSKFINIMTPYEKVNSVSNPCYGPASITVNQSSSYPQPVIAYETYQWPTWFLPSRRRVCVQQRDWKVTSNPLANPWWEYTYPFLSMSRAHNGFDINKPTIGSQPYCGSSRTLDGLRVAFNSGYGDIRVFQAGDPINCGYSLKKQALGWDPTMTAHTNVSGRLREAYCGISSFAPIGGLHEIMTTNQALQKVQDIDLANMRQVYVCKDTGFAVFGVENPRVIPGIGDEIALDWDVAHDTLVIGVNTTLEEKMKTASFVVPSSAAFLFETEMYASNPEVLADSSLFVVKFIEESTGHTLLSSVFPVGEFPTDTADAGTIYISLSSLTGINVYATVGFISQTENPSIQIGDMYYEAAVPEKNRRLDAGQPLEFALEQNQPNPFSSSTSFTFTLPEEADVQLAVYDNLGRKVKTVVSGHRGPGRYTYAFDAGSLPSGMYFYRLDANGASVTKKMILAR